LKVKINVRTFCIFIVFGLNDIILPVGSGMSVVVLEVDVDGVSVLLGMLEVMLGPADEDGDVLLLSGVGAENVSLVNCSEVENKFVIDLDVLEDVSEDWRSELVVSGIEGDDVDCSVRSVEETTTGTDDLAIDIFVLPIEGTRAVSFPEVEGTLTVVLLVGRFADDISGAFEDDVYCCLLVVDCGICVEDLKMWSVEKVFAAFGVWDVAGCGVDRRFSQNFPVKFPKHSQICLPSAVLLHLPF
jgi:hypothetical protein